MNWPLKRYLPLVILLIVICGCSASRKTTSLWTTVKSTDFNPASEVLPSDFGLYQLDIGLLTDALKEVGTDEDNGIFVQFPTPDGIMNNFKIWRSSVVSEALLKKYPNLNAYQGFSISDQSNIRMELPTQGLQVMVSSVGKTWFVAPYDKEQQLYMVFYKISDDKLVYTLIHGWNET